jgi:hypothetical protein
MKYRDHHSSELIETHWCASVSHHHYYFETYAEVVAFFDSPLYDLRMQISSPAN